ncbi:MAG: HDOD domain-containing protein [Myxococcaceae bacterium]
MVANTAPNYGRGEYELPSDTPDLEAYEQELRVWFDGFLERPNLQLPRPPQVALEVAELSRKPNARIEDIAKVLEREPLLAGRVLKLANSALYGGSVACVTLKQALIRMGLSIVRDVVMEAAMSMMVIRTPGFDETLESIRRHSSAVAWISRFVARNTAIDAENAFLLGLLHDVGLSIGLVAAAEFKKAKKLPQRLDALTWLAAEASHERYSEAVLNNWGLPPTVTLVVGHHHSLMMGGYAHPQVAVMMVAEQIAQEAGWSVNPTVEQGPDQLALASAQESTPNRSNADEVDRALKALNLTRTHYQMVQADTKRVLETLESQFKQRG